MSKFEYTTVDRIFAKLARDMGAFAPNEDDTIEWIGEALDAMSMPEVQETVVAFLPVKNHEVAVPKGLRYIFQIAKLNEDMVSDPCPPLKDKECEVLPPVDEGCFNILDENLSNAAILDSFLKRENHPRMMDMTFPWKALNWLQSSYYQRKFELVRPSSNVFFNSVICVDDTIYTPNCCEQEYSIVGSLERKFRFSFEEGLITISYSRSALSEEGYPLIPDSYSHINAISYYVKWKVAERMYWEGREGSKSLVDDSEKKWIKYIGQANNLAKMPQTLDDYQDLLEQSVYLIPNHKQYYSNFGQLNQKENLVYKQNIRRYGR